MLKAEDEARIWPQMIPRYLRPPLEFLPMGDSDTSIDVGAWMRYCQLTLAQAFMIPVELLSSPEKKNESLSDSQAKPTL